MTLKADHRGFDDLTEEEAMAFAMEAYKESMKKAYETEDPPEYIDENSSPVAAEILADLEEDEEIVEED